ncbi:peptidase [Iodidimonas nitroreducens]|uniref:Peptidase n=1 Tax=Iodidimonas nitroreducens TaxID=1236968 RepID=A0A5A7N906_9PROT|nr:M23 family metallopeptidase [Iodidimonas nitroreducens]GAK33975.1 putative metalloprotease BUsg_310 [alpha proteobacterium Q-1]GER03900.1 peptidase [Iodidimonas nitroreducens]
MRAFLMILGAILMVAAPYAKASDPFASLPDLLNGHLAQGGMVIGKTTPGSAVFLNDQLVRVAADGRFVIGFGRDAPLSHILRIKSPDGRVAQHDLTLEDRDFKVERVDGLPPDTVTPPPEYYERRRHETGQVRTARAEMSDLMAWSDGFILPAKGRISGVYGSQRILNGEPRSPHYGLDVAAAPGTAVVAPAAGIVRLAAPDFLLEGGILIIDHGFGVSSTLMHLKSVDVAVGDHVEQGEPVATLGATGRASGPHVDWRINWLDTRIDPQLVLQMPQQEGAAP